VPIPEGMRKYDRRTLWVKLTPQLRAAQDSTALSRGLAQAGLTAFDMKLIKLLDDLGVYTDMRAQYLAYARALNKSQDEMAWMVDLIREHQILRQRFEGRGLSPEVLQAIDDLVIYRTRNL